MRVGIDLVAVGSVANAITEHGDRYLKRIYTDEELRDCAAGTGYDHRRLAARFAAKEAAMKVIREADEPLPWRSIEVRRGPHGRPALALDGPARAVARAGRVTGFSLSITHEDSYAAAAVTAEVPELP